MALANLELFINKIKAVVYVRIPTNSDIITLTPNDTGEDKNIYVFNSKQVNSRTQNVLRGVSIDEYETLIIREHIASKIYKALRNIGSTIVHIPASYMPMNDIFRTLCYGSDLINTVDPLSADNETDYRIMLPKGSNVMAFIDDEHVYVRRI